MLDKGNSLRRRVYIGLLTDFFSVERVDWGRRGVLVIIGSWSFAEVAAVMILVGYC